MSFLDLAARRQSVREFSPRPVEREIIERCLEAARLAPSACNGQPWRFIVIDEPKAKTAAAEAASSFGMNGFAAQAPVLLAVIMEPTATSARIGGAVKGIDYRSYDIGLAVMQFCLQAEEEGLGTCILGWFGKRKVRRLLGIPRGRKIPLLIALGRPANPEIQPKQRKKMEEIRAYNKY